MRSFWLAPLLLLSLGAPACATSRGVAPSARTDGLGLERVVLYRNGIGYFERRGDVEGDVLRVKVRRDQIDDLLKSLTVIDQASGRAVSVSMPLDPADWARAAMATVDPDSGSLAQVLAGLRGTEVVLHTTVGRVRGRIVMVEEIVNEPDGEANPPRHVEGMNAQPQRDHRVTLLRGDQLEVVRLSKVRGVTLEDGDLALQLHRRLDAAAGEGMFQQVDVAIRLTGARSHDLLVSYVVAAPMWKPTYRVVLPEDGKGEALLQGWAVVDNVSGEDWNDVRMSLTSGEPIAFRYDLHTPRDVTRTDLTETGVRKRARVAVGETTFDDTIVDEEMAQSEEQAAFGDDGDLAQNQERAKAKKESRADKVSATRSGGGRSRDVSAALDTPTGGAAPSAPRPAAEPEPALDFDALRRSTQATARAERVSGMTRFDLGEPVTVPNGSSTMVAIVNEAVQAEETFLYKPGGAGIGYEANPYRVVRFKNDTPFVLEPGPISIYSGGSFVGEGLSEAVGTRTSATIPFAVEPSLMVSSSVERKGDEMRLLRITRGVLEVESFARTETTWTAKGNRSKAARNVLVRHPKAGWNYALVEKPEGTEELPDGYLVPLSIPAGKSEGVIKVVEQTPSRTTLSIWDARAPGLLEQLLVAKDVTPEVRSKLEPIAQLRQEIGRIDTEVDGLKRQQVELDQRAEQTRANLEAIKKDSAAGGLRRKLSQRLEEFTAQADELGRRVVELQSQRLEKKIELEDKLQDLDLRTRAPSKPSKK